MARVGRQTKTREYKDLDAHFTAHLGYSHHQKAVICDAPLGGKTPPGSNLTRLRPSPEKANGGLNPPSNGSHHNVDETRRIIAYVGGIDLTGIYK